MERKTIECVPSLKCTGCFACYNTCRFNAIEMAEDEEGFLYPKIKEDSCIHCGECAAKCPVLHPLSLHKTEKVYSAWADQQTRLRSSSGGIFSLLAQYVLDKGGVVCGAAFDERFQHVFHVWADSKEKLSDMRKAKYVQSEVGTTFRETKEFLNKGIPVLYSGCGCQISGLRNYLGKDYENLITVDIVCHGVPSPRVYRDYLEELSAGRTVIRVDFREKEHWGWGSATSVFFNDGSVYRGDCYTDPYFVSFLGSLSTRKSCSECAYTSFDRPGDITLGDFWGIEKIDEKSSDGQGTSIVLINTKKGKRIFSSVKKHCSLVRKQDLDKTKEICEESNGALIHPFINVKGRRDFFSLRKDYPVIEAMKIAGTEKYRYDIGYVGWWDSKNYGSSLTCFALNRTLKNMGYSVLMLEHPGIRPGYDSVGLQFARHFYQISDITAEKDFTRFNQVCDTFVVGSDQLWNYSCNAGIGGNYYFLDFVYNEHRKISYATSFGIDRQKYPENDRIRVAYYMSKFDAISVREKSGVDICEKDFDVPAVWVMDPVFLCDKESYDEIVSLSAKHENEPYIFSYILDPTEEKIEAVRLLSEKMQLPYHIAIDALGNKKDNLERLRNDPNIISDLRIEDWLYYIQNAEFVLTDSFHGFCFSLINQKECAAFINLRRGAARFNSIAEITSLSDRLFDSLEDFKQRKIWEKQIDYRAVNEKLQERIEFSRKWLRDALKTERRGANAHELQLWKTIEHDKRIYELEMQNKELRKQIEELKKQLESIPSRGNFFGKGFRK